MEQTIETRQLADLTEHPKNRFIYGDDVDDVDVKLAESLASGIWPGHIQVTPSNVIISGHRRRALANLHDIKEAEVWVRHDLPDDPMSLDVLEVMLASNHSRVKTNAQMARETELLMAIKKTKAERRRNANLKRGNKRRTHQPEDDLQQAESIDSRSGHCVRNGSQEDILIEKGDARDLAAVQSGLDLSGKRLQEVLEAVKAADKAIASGDPEQVEKGMLVLAKVNEKPLTGVRVAREQGLLTPKQRKAPAKKPKAQDSDSPARSTRKPKPASQPIEVQKLPDIALTAPKQVHSREAPRIKERWVPAVADLVNAKAQLLNAKTLLQQEHVRIRANWNNKHDGSRTCELLYRRLAEDWQNMGNAAPITEVATILGIEGAPLATLIKEISQSAEEISQNANSIVHAMRGISIYMGCEKPHTQHD